MKRISVVGALLSLVIVSIECSAANYYTLYGYKIGQELKIAKQRLGEPDKIAPFQDGWKAYAYRRDGHNIIFETDNTRPDLIVSIQVEGNQNPPNMGLDGIDLGSDAKKATEKLGPPTQRKMAEDLDTKKAIPKTYINYYGNSLSFEEKDNKVTSIKIVFGGPAKASDRPDFDAFLQNVKARNYYRIAETISSGMTLNGKMVIQGPVIEQIVGKTELNAFLFGKDGVEAVTPKDIADVNLRVIAADREKRISGSSGYVYKLRGKPITELYFVRSFEGWVLYDAW